MSTKSDMSPTNDTSNIASTHRTHTTQDFDERARTWDDDPKKVQRADDIARAIARHVPLRQHMHGFEYGCGTGLVSFALAESLGDITLADSSSGMLAVLAEKIARYGQRSGGRTMQPRHLDLSTQALPPERFDIVYTAMTLHHIPNTEQVLQQLHDLLSPQGYLCIADLDAEDGSFHGLDVDVHHGFDRTVLGAQLTQSGFTSVLFDTAMTMQREARSYPVFVAIAQRS